MSVRFEIDGYSSIDALILWHNTRQPVWSHIRQHKNEDGMATRKPSGRGKYGKSASEARRERDASEEEGDAQIRQDWKNRKEPEAGNCNRFVRSAKKRSKGPSQTRGTKAFGRKKAVEPLTG